MGPRCASSLHPPPGVGHPSQEVPLSSSPLTLPQLPLCLHLGGRFSGGLSSPHRQTRQVLCVPGPRSCLAGALHHLRLSIFPHPLSPSIPASLVCTVPRAAPIPGEKEGVWGTLRKPRAPPRPATQRCGSSVLNPPGSGRVSLPGPGGPRPHVVRLPPTPQRPTLLRPGHRPVAQPWQGPAASPPVTAARGSPPMRLSSVL